MVANPLTLVMPIKSADDYRQLKALLEKMQSAPPDKNPISLALTKIGTVHFARFVFLEENQLAVITTYDEDFEAYVTSFVNAIGGVFDQLLVHIQDPPPLPVQKNAIDFSAWVKAHDLKCLGVLYSAYPDLKVQDILTMQKEKRDE